MPFIQRDEAGQIAAVFKERQPRTAEISSHDPELRRFLLAKAEHIVEESAGTPPHDSPDVMAQSDREMSRVVEDLVDLMIAKRLISFGELPKPAQRKLLRRRELRGHVEWLNSIVADDKVI